MGQAINRIKYAARDAGEAILKDSVEALIYWYYLSYKPMAILRTTDLIGDFYRLNAVRQRLDRLHKSGHIHKISKPRNVSFTFNKDKRFEFLSKDIGTKAQSFKKKWDGKWRLVIYDIPEKQQLRRNALRKYLCALGFGKVQDSCWVSCYDYAGYINDYCLKNSILDCVCIYEGKFFSGKKEDDLVEEAWGLNWLNAKYKDLLTESGSLIEELETKDVNFKDYYQRYLSVFSRYKGLLVIDPFLPENFSNIWKNRELVEKTISKVFSLTTKSSFVKF